MVGRKNGTTVVPQNSYLQYKLIKIKSSSVKKIANKKLGPEYYSELLVKVSTTFSKIFVSNWTHLGKQKIY